METRLAIAAAAFVVGTLLGSYAVTAGLRWARSEPSSAGRSHCDSCDAVLSFRETVPLLSFLWLRGACRRCRSRIDPIHLVGEAAGGGVLASLALVDFSVRGVVLALLGLLLIAAATVDARTKRLPDALTLWIALSAGTAAALKGLDHLVAGAAAAAIAGLLLWGLRQARWGSKDPGLGLGDVKLIAALALWLGPATAWMAATAAIVGLVTLIFHRPADGRLPFGPMIALASWGVGMANEVGWFAWQT